MNAPPLRLLLFGGLELKVGETSRTLDPRDRYMLLAFVACRGGEVPRQAVAKALWDEEKGVFAPDESLRRALLDLRTDLARSLPSGCDLELPGEARFLYLPKAKTSLIRLAPEHWTSDVGDFLSGLKRVRPTDPKDEQLARLVEAIESYAEYQLRGPLLDGYPWKWIESERENLAHRYEAAIEQRDRLLEQAHSASSRPHNPPASPPSPGFPTRNSPLPADRTTRSDPRADTGLRIVLLHRRHASHAEHMLDLLEARLTAHGHAVFIDRQMNVGTELSHEVKRQVRIADAVIALLSAESIWSERLEDEVKAAHAAARQQGDRPRILPLRLLYTDPLPEPLGAILEGNHCALWEGPEDDERIVTEILEELRRPPPRRRLEPVSGAIPPGSPFYILRPADDAFTSALTGREGLVLIKGARQTGKTSLLARGLERARATGMRIAVTDLQEWERKDFESASRLYLCLATAITEQLDLAVSPRERWDPDLGANGNLKRFLLRDALEASPEPLVWAIDEADRLFSLDYSNDVFSLFRSWYNRRALEPASPWQRLTVAIAYATEARLFITDLNQSPFNVGTQIALEDFTLDQVEELNVRYEKPLRSPEETASFHRLLGGQPYLTRRGLHELALRGMSYAAFEREADRDEGPFGDHLRRVLALIQAGWETGPFRETAMSEVVEGVLRNESCPTADQFHSLRGAGILAGATPDSTAFRCELYRAYLTRHLPHCGGCDETEPSRRRR